MARQPLPLLVPTPHGEHQKYACRSCPARCCKTWGIQLLPEEAERIARDPQAVARLTAEAPRILAGGQLPMRERAGELSCVFLDEDDLCSLHKRHGHAFLPRACQAYPFGVAQNEDSAEIALLSRYCPSIAQNYGEPVRQVLAAQRKHLDAPRALSARMGLRSGRTLPLPQYIAVVDAWQRELTSSTHIARSLARLFALTEAVDHALPSARAPNDQEFKTLLDAADQATPLPQLAVRRQKWGARILIAHLLGALCRPLRLMQAFNIQPITLGQRLAAAWLRVKWLLGRGQVQLLLIEAPISLRALERVPGGLSGPHAPLIAQYLREVLARRQGMHKQTYLHRFVIELGLMALVLSRYARAHALGRGHTTLDEAAVREGIGIAELVLTHQGELGQSLVLDQLRLQLLSNPEDFFSLLAAEQ